MCVGVMYVNNDAIETVYFSSPKAVMPVQFADGHIEKLPWGRRVQQQSDMPIGRYANYESLKKGVWNALFPKPVKLLVSNFAEVDQYTDEMKWHAVMKGTYIQGAVATDNGEKRVYVVSVQTPPNSIYRHWPRILASRA